jgi:hypothetical protein
LIFEDLRFRFRRNSGQADSRVALEMLDAIDDDNLAQVQSSGPSRVTVSSHACHRERPRAMTIAEELAEALEQGETQKAIEAFALDSELLPQPINVDDHLGEAWVAAGDPTRALEKDPRNKSARSELEELRVKD